MARFDRLALAGLLSTVLLAPQAWGQDCTVPIELPDKPRIENFADYNDFVVEIMKYKKQKRAQEQHRKQCPRAYVVRERPNPDPTVIEGPETLGEALRRTRRLPKVDYASNQKWYNRSTSRSFGLPGLSSNEMSQRSINARIRNLSPTQARPDRSDAESESPTAGIRNPYARERALLARKLEQRREGENIGPLAGSNVLPLVYADELNLSSVDGSGALSGVNEQLVYQLLLTEQLMAELEAPQNRFSNVAYATVTTGETENNSMIYIFAEDGEALTMRTTIYGSYCLSSCLHD